MNATLAGKPGYKTTEFWLTLAAVVVSTLTTSGAFPDDSGVMPILGMVATVLSTLGYQATRTLRKNTKTKAMAIAGPSEPSEG